MYKVDRDGCLEIGGDKWGCGIYQNWIKPMAGVFLGINRYDYDLYIILRIPFLCSIYFGVNFLTDRQRIALFEKLKYEAITLVDIYIFENYFIFRLLTPTDIWSSKTPKMQNFSIALNGCRFTENISRARNHV